MKKAVFALAVVTSIAIPVAVSNNYSPSNSRVEGILATELVADGSPRPPLPPPPARDGSPRPPLPPSALLA